MSDIVHILGELATPEQADRLVRGYRVLSSLGDTEHITRTEEMINDSGGIAAFEFVQNCRKIIEEVQFIHLRELRIKTSEEVDYDLDVFNDVLEGISTVMNTDHAGNLVSIIENEETDDVEKLYQILEPVIETPEDKFYLVISEVGPALFNRIMEVSEDVLPEPLIEDVSLRYVTSRVRTAIPIAMKFMVVDEDGTVYSACLAHLDSAPLGYDFKAALQLLHSDIMESGSINEKIANIFVILCGSSIKSVEEAFPVIVEVYLEPSELLSSGPTIARLSSAVAGM